MPRKTPSPSQRARTARRESKRLDFKAFFDPSRTADWPELLKDVMAFANSGGGLIVFGVNDDGTAVPDWDPAPLLTLDPAVVADKVEKYTGQTFSDFEMHSVDRDGHAVAVLEIGPSLDAPIAFTQVGSYEVTPDPGAKQKQKTAFSKGSVYFRHGARSTPGNTQDLREFINRRIDQFRAQWLEDIRRVVEAPADSEVAIVEAVARDQAGMPTEIRITDDLRAPVYGRLSPDRTHPYRQKELLTVVNDRLPDGVEINTHDMLSVRRAYQISEATHAHWTHEPRWASQQYSDAFADWLVDQYRRDHSFFQSARDAYQSDRTLSVKS